MRGSNHGVVPGSGPGSLPPFLTASILLVLPGPGFALAWSVQRGPVPTVLPSAQGCCLEVKLCLFF